MRLAPLISLTVTLTACGTTLDPRQHKVDKATTPHNSDQTQAQICGKPTVHSLSRPMVPDSPAAGSFTYAFEYVAPTAPGAPTIVQIPGGPGQTAIGQSDDWVAMLPPGYGYMLTDPRGVGCNAPTNLDTQPVAFYRTVWVADDINAAIKSLGLDNYFLYGISYGTAVATIAASRASVINLTQPKGVVLEGVLGRALEGDEADSTYKSLWDAKLAANIPLRNAFAQTPLPLGLKDEDWISTIHMGLMFGQMETAGGPTDVLDLITERAISTDATQQSWAKTTIAKLVQGTNDMTGTDAAQVFYTYIACQEIFQNITGESLVTGHLVESKDSLCSQVTPPLSFNADKFDAAKWPITAPIYYFEGENDPATPMTVAQYHFDHQTAAPRQMVIVGKGGHNPFELSLEKCYQGIWGELAAGGKQLQASVDKCGWTPGAKLKAGTALVSQPLAAK